MKKLMTFLIALVFSSITWGQTVLISPTGDGGFETGATLAANGWTVVNSTTNTWQVSGVAVPFAGSNSAFISNDAGVSYAYTNTLNQTSHFYRDITVPAGESKINLSFQWKGNGESGYDRLLIYVAPTSVTPVIDDPLSSSTALTGATLIYTQTSYTQTAYGPVTISLPSNLAGTTFRLILTWQNDDSAGTTPGASIDNISLTSAVPDPLHGIYTIDNTMLTTTPMVHDGTGNFASFTAAINHMNSEGISDDVTFNVLTDLIFTEDCPAITATGTAANTITFHRFGSGANPVIKPTGTTGTSDAGIIINGGDYITFDGIDITIATGSAVEYGYFIRNASATNGAKYNTVKNSKIILNRTNTSSKGIYQYRSVTASDTNGTNSHNLYQSNIIENSYMGIYVYGSSSYPDYGTYITYNIVGAATANDIGAGSSTTNGIRASYQNGVMIAANTVRNVSTTGASLYGIYLEGGQGTNNIFNNKVYSIGTTSTSTSYVVYGIRTDINSTYTTNVFNNMVSDLNHGIATASSTQVIRAMAVGISGTGTGNFIYNTVKISEDAFPTSTAMYIGGGTVYTVDNVFVNASTAGSTSKRYCIYRSSGTLLSDYNDLYVDVAGTNNFTGYYTADQNTLANWQTASGGLDMHSISVNPTFTSLTDLHTTTSALNGIGTPIAGITFDIDMDTRDVNTPDLGADENLAPPAYTCTTPVPGNTLTTANNLCLGQSVVLSLQNATSGTGVIYQWQRSTDGITYTNISGAISSTYAVTPAANTYYQCIVTCLNGPSSATSTPVQVTFANSILTTTPGSRCGTGTLSLAATATPGATINWYDAVTDTLMGTGSPWVTPIIGATTTFNVAAEIPALGSVIGAGASTSSSYQSPFNHTWGGTKSQFLIRASELTAAGFAAGDINTLGIMVVAAGIPYSEFNLNMGSTMDTALTTTFVTGLANVYYDPALTLSTGFYNFTLANAYNWDGASNVVIEFCWSNNNTGGTSATVKVDATPFVAESYFRDDSQTPAVLCAAATATGTYSYRPQFYLNYTPMCAGPRVPVVANVSTAAALTLAADQTVCNNSVATIAVTSTLGDYDSYVWTPETDLYTDAACTTPYVSGASATTVYVKSATAGTTTYTCSANNSVSQCSNITSTAVTTLPAAPAITAATSDICVSGATTITTLPASGYGTATFQWQNSTDNITFNDISGATALNYTTPTITSTTYYKLLIKLGATVCTESNVATVTVNNPQVVSTTPGSRCGTGTVNLSATGSAGTDISWFANATGGTSLYTGTNFVTPSISATTDYYVAATIGETTISGGRLAPTATSTTTAYSYGLVFDAYNDFVLQSVDVYATTVGNVEVQLQNNTGTMLQSITVPVIAGGATTPQTINLNFNVPAGTGLRLIAVSSPSMVRESSLGGFPYSLGANGSITSGYISGTSSTYYFFYNWEMKTGCSSARTMVTATVNTAPAIAVSATPDTICAGLSTTLAASSSNASYTYTWTPATTPATGSSVSGSPVSTTTYTVNANDNSGGTYDGCAAVATVNVNVKPSPSSVTATASSNTICIGASVDLFSSAISNDTSFVTVLTESFEAMPTPPVDWTFINAGTGNPWGYYSTAHSGAYSLTYGYSSTDPADAWAITNPLTLNAGTTYTISFWYEIASDSYPEKLKVTVGNDTTVLAQTTTLWDNNGDTALFNDTWEQAVITYNPVTSGTYYFGFNCYSDADMFRLYVDDVEISGTTINPVTFSWTSLPAGYTSTDQNPVGVIPAATGAIQYIVAAQNSIGCSTTASTTVTVDPCTGVEENNDGISVSIVPNPSNGLFYLNVNGINETVTMNIYSISGQLVYTEQLDNKGLVNKTVDLGSYPKGMYFLRLINKNITHTEKIIIE